MIKKQVNLAQNSHVALGKFENLQATAESCAIDAADDRRWFQAHPSLKERTRLATGREREAAGLPPGSLVHVRLFPNGAQARMFLEPNAINN